MKASVIFLIKTIALTLLLSQATTSDTGYAVISNPVNEPVFLTLCGLALLAFGVFGQRQSS